MEYKYVPFYEFNHFLSDVILEQYPDAALLMINGGDCVWDIEIEVRRKSGSFKYRPYALYQKVKGRCCR